MSMKSKTILPFLIVLIISISIPIGVRLIELPKWQKPSLEINGEKLMATHDAYYFLAGAIGTGRNPHEPLAQMVRTISKITSIPIPTVGFFLPAIFCSLLVVPIVFLAKDEDILEGAIVTSILGACCLGYLGRSRLGFLDTDFGMGILIAFCATITMWLNRKKNYEDYLNIETNIPPFLIGLIGALYMWFYPSGKSLVLFSIFVALISSIIINFKKGEKLFSYIPGILIIFISCFDVLVAALTFITIVAYLYVSNKKERKIYYGLLGICAIIATIHSTIYSVIYSGIIQILTYAKIVPYSIETSKNASLQLPSVAQSVKEVQNIKFSSAVIKISQNWPTFILGCIGLLYLFIKKPSYLVFILFIILGVASTKLGNRFTMYGGVAIGMGLGFGIGMFLREILPKTGRWLAQIAISILVLIPIVQIAMKFYPVPVLPKIYAQTFIEASKIIPKDARLWQWWDYGYACQYYAKRPSFGDGGLHKGPYLYPLAVVHTSSSPMQAAELMKFITFSQMEEYKNESEKYKNVPDVWKIYSPDPVAGLRKMGPENSTIFLEKLKGHPFLSLLKRPKFRVYNSTTKDLNLPPQYLVLSWENLRLAYWISYFGTWDMVSAQAFPGKIQSVRGNIAINFKEGFVTINGKKLNLDGFIIIDKNRKTRNFSWSHGTDLFGIFNSLSREFFLMDGTIFYSNMIQMLLEPPSLFKANFKLVVDHFPWTRVYQVK